jgi:hypothetical protein
MAAVRQTGMISGLQSTPLKTRIAFSSMLRITPLGKNNAAEERQFLQDMAFKSANAPYQTHMFIKELTQLVNAINQAASQRNQVPGFETTDLFDGRQTLFRLFAVAEVFYAVTGDTFKALKQFIQNASKQQSRIPNVSELEAQFVKDCQNSGQKVYDIQLRPPGYLGKKPSGLSTQPVTSQVLN